VGTVPVGCFTVRFARFGGWFARGLPSQRPGDDERVFGLPHGMREKPRDQFTFPISVGRLIGFSDVELGIADRAGRSIVDRKFRLIGEVLIEWLIMEG
jgi:hypothetical protein